MLISQFLKASGMTLMLKLYLFLCMLMQLSAPAYSQNKPGYSLLWRISGHGLKKSSYLFGTMHVKDNVLLASATR
ncbi:hypothetical protein MUGA111182_10135 [Mucilaginibacter galii]|uniref:hypothetical protein n=1 Tax=Mucilaginibacter galii TaxID=2005073 RepID=UPI001666042A|nr:hypothetical protein [Mucilaginibacter galii]